MSFARFTSLFVSASLAVAACAGEVHITPGTGHEGGSGGGAGGTTVTTSDSTSTTSISISTSTTCTADLDTDPHHCGACGHDCLGGACVGSACQPILLAKQDGQPWEIALDATHVYWSNTHGEISKVPKAGGATVVLTSDLSNPGALAVHANRVYSASYGSSVKVIPKTGGALSNLTPKAAGGLAVAVDDGGVFWSQGISWPGDHYIARTDLDGAPTTVIGSIDHEPTAASLDATHVYWSDFDLTVPALGGIRRAPRGGGATETLVTGDSLNGAALDGERVYYLYSGSSGASWADGALHAVSKTGGAPVLLASPLDGAARVAVDGTHVYWSEAYGQVIRRVKKTGGPTETLATSDGNPQGIAVDEVAVYWVDPGNQSVMKLAK